MNFNFLPFSLSETVTAAINAVPTERSATSIWVCRLAPPSARSDGFRCRSKPKAGRDQRWNVGFQQELFPLTTLEVNYVGTTGAHQQQAENINLPPAGPGSVQTRRPYPRFGNLSVNTQAMSSRYHALQTKLQKRVSDGFWYLVSYTYSSSLRTVPAPEIGGNYVYEEGPTPSDTPQLFAFSSGYALPFARNNSLLGGWQVQTIVNFRSGLPFTPTISRDVANNGVGGQRPNRIGSGTVASPTIDQWFDKTAFVVPDPFTFGNSGAGILRADHQWNVDASLFKRFAIPSGGRIELRAEAFNLLNSVYFAAPNTVIDTAAGGRVTSTSNQARQIQLGVKYTF